MGFWTEAARTVCAAILTKLVKERKCSDGEVEKTHLLSPREIFLLFPAESKAASHVLGGDNQITAIMYMIIKSFLKLFPPEMGPKQPAGERRQLSRSCPIPQAYRPYPGNQDPLLFTLHRPFFWAGLFNVPSLSQEHVETASQCATSEPHSPFEHPSSTKTRSCPGCLCI